MKKIITLSVFFVLTFQFLNAQKWGCKDIKTFGQHGDQVGIEECLKNDDGKVVFPFHIQMPKDFPIYCLPKIEVGGSMLNGVQEKFLSQNIFYDNLEYDLDPLFCEAPIQYCSLEFEFDLIDENFNCGTVILDLKLSVFCMVDGDEGHTLESTFPECLKDDNDPDNNFWTLSLQYEICCHENIVVGSYAQDIDIDNFSQSNVDPIAFNSINFDRISELESLSIFPNPFNSTLNITSIGEEINCINVFSSNGDLVDSALKIFKQDFQFDLEYLDNGIYFIQVKYENGDSITRKLFKF